ncbi:MAG: FG-GAP repeat protein [Bacteroidota bacterium]
MIRLHTTGQKSESALRCSAFTTTAGRPRSPRFGAGSGVGLGLRRLFAPFLAAQKGRPAAGDTQFGNRKHKGIREMPSGRIRLFFCSLLLSLGQLSAQTFWGNTEMPIPADWTGGIAFGSAIELSGNIAAIAAERHYLDENGANLLPSAGAVYVFEKGVNGWTEKQKLVSPDRSEGSWFGSAIHLTSEQLLIGALYSNLGLPGDSMMDRAGSVYVFEPDSSGNWSFVQKLVASDRQPHDFFGASIDVHDSLAIIGAYGKDPSGPGGDAIIQAGGAYIFQLNPDGLWTEIASLSEPDTALQDWYGFEVAIQGNTAVVGAPQEDEDSLNTNTLINTGAAYVYQQQADGSWPLLQKLVGPARDYPADQMGRSMAIQGDELVIARPVRRVQDSSGTFFFGVGDLTIWHQNPNGYFELDTTLHPIDSELKHSIWLGTVPSALTFEGDWLLAGGGKGS